VSKQSEQLHRDRHAARRGNKQLNLQPDALELGMTDIPGKTLTSILDKTITGEYELVSFLRAAESWMSVSGIHCKHYANAEIQTCVIHRYGTKLFFFSWKVVERST
jgi:hypothetical protein